MKALFLFLIFLFISPACLAASCANTCSAVDAGNGCSIPPAGSCTITADGQTCTVNNGSGFTHFVAAKEASGNWASFANNLPTGVSKSCSLPGSPCASQTLNWTVAASSCQAMVSGVNDGLSSTGTDTTGPDTGSADFTCNNGSWSAPANAACSSGGGGWNQDYVEMCGCGAFPETNDTWTISWTAPNSCTAVDQDGNSFISYPSGTSLRFTLNAGAGGRVSVSCNSAPSFSVSSAGSCSNYDCP